MIRYRTPMTGPDIGETLRRAREDRGLSLDEIARRTHIAARLLDSIERNALEEIPGGVYTRGYLRAYATEVDLDGENLLRAHACHLEDPSDDDLLQQLRARLHTLDRNRWSVVRFVLVVAGVVCLLYVLAAIQTPSPGTQEIPDASNAITGPSDRGSLPGQDRVQT